MKVLDLFAGLKGWSEPWEKRGHDVRSLELDPKFKGITYTMDVREFQKNMDTILGGWLPDVILASPPCSAFSVLRIGRNWNHDHTPKTDDARLGMELVTATIDIIERLNPRYFVIENPRAKLRKMPFMQQFECRTVTYCQYGENRMKPTDLFSSRFPPSWKAKPICGPGKPCHISAPRGSYTGTQGMDSAVSAKIPEALSLAICEAAEKDLV